MQAWWLTHLKTFFFFLTCNPFRGIVKKGGKAIRRILLTFSTTITMMTTVGRWIRKEHSSNTMPFQCLAMERQIRRVTISRESNTGIKETTSI